MSDISKLKVKGVEYDIKDDTARTALGSKQDSLNEEQLANVNKEFADVATSGSYNDLTDTPLEVTEATVNGWGFTKNTYSKPTNGIPKTDLSSDVQTSLGKADSALQTETDPVFVASAAHGITSSDITNWNGKTSNVGTITGITMNGSSKGTSGVVDLGTVITAHQDISGKQDSLTTEQLNACNSGITSTKVSTYDGYASTISGKADKASITAGTVGTSSATSGSSLDVPYVTMNAQGIVTGYGTHTHTVNGFLTSSSTLDATKLSGTVPSGCYTNTVTTATTSGSGNAVTSITASNGALTVTKDTTFLTSHQDISGKANLSGATFTGNVTAPKFITSTGLEIY